jgi:glycosyltransferase involved in cell wall biosynthesis
MKKIALMTPLKDEMENIEKYLAAISNQTYKIEYLVIVENDSIDGSKEYLNQLKEIDNVESFKVINMTFEDKSYDLEFKYSGVVAEAYKHLKELDNYEELDYIGILDCDCFPEPDYFEKMIHFMDSRPKLGISSGIAYTAEGKIHIADPNWVRGFCRIWRRECLDQTGFPIEPSPDSITVALAHVYGWKTETLKTARVECREVNIRLENYRNFGERSYYRGDSPFFAILKSLHFILFKGKFRMGRDFLKGYFGDLFRGKSRIPIKKVRQYYRFYLIRKTLRAFNP